jgi:hypothetical protein
VAREKRGARHKGAHRRVRVVSDRKIALWALFISAGGFMAGVGQLAVSVMALGGASGSQITWTAPRVVTFGPGGTFYPETVQGWLSLTDPDLPATAVFTAGNSDPALNWGITAP